MYTQEQEQIRMSLYQFFGSILVNSNLQESEMRKQSLIALTLEELVKFCKKEDNTVDIVVAKPILKATEYLLKNRKEDITKSMTDAGFEQRVVENATEDINDIIIDLNKYIENIK